MSGPPRRLLSTLLATGLAGALLLAGSAGAQDDTRDAARDSGRSLAGTSVEERAETRAALAGEMDALRDRLAELGADDPTARPLHSELGRLERLDVLLVRQQSLFDQRERLVQAEAAMQAKLAAGPESDVSDNPPYPIALLDLLGDAADGLERQRGVLESAARAAKAAVETAREQQGEAERERRRVLEEIDRASDPIGNARAQAALRIADLDLRIVRTRVELAELEQDAAQRDRKLHDHNLTITRAVLEFVERHLDLTRELRAELLLGLQQQELELRRERERASLDLERAQARRLAAEQRRDRLDRLTPTVIAENDALAARQETLQLQVTTLAQQEERLESVRSLRERRYQTLAGEAPRPEMRGWESELRSFAAELQRQLQLEDGRSAQVRSMRDEVQILGQDIAQRDPQRRWLDEHLRALNDRLAIHQREIEDIRHARSHALRFQGELERRTARMTLDDRIEILLRRAGAAWEAELASFDDRPITLGKVVTALLVLIIGLIVARVLSRWIARFSARRMSLEEGAAASFQSLSYYALAVAFLLIALRSANIPLTIFTLLGGAFAIGLGFGSQNVIANFLSGLILLVERPIKVGDMIEVDGTLGRVESIGLRATRVRTFDNIHIILPNSSFLEKNVVNWNLRDDIVRGQVNVGVAYGSNTREVERLLLQAASEQRLVLEDPEPTVLFRDFADNALAFRLYFWIRARNVLDRVRLESDIRYRIDELFRESDVVIAFPQRDVHLDTASPLQIEWARGEAAGPERGEDPEP